MDNKNVIRSRLQRPVSLRTAVSKYDDEVFLRTLSDPAIASLSPVTDLAHNLSGTSLDSTPTKRPVDNDFRTSPVSTRGLAVGGEGRSPCKSLSSNRLTKASEFLPGVGNNGPLSGSPDKRNTVNKESLSQGRSRSALAVIDTNSNTKENSFVKPGAPLSLNLRMPSIDEHDASSRDSGCDPGDNSAFKYPEYPIGGRRSNKSFNSPAAARNSSSSSSRSGSSSSVRRSASGVARLDFSSASDEDEGFPTELYDNMEDCNALYTDLMVKTLCEKRVTHSAEALVSAVDDSDAAQEVTAHEPVREPQAKPSAAQSGRPCLTRSVSMLNYGTPNTRNALGSPVAGGSPFDYGEDAGASPVGALGLHLHRRQPIRLYHTALNQAAKRYPSDEMSQANKRRKSDENEDPAAKDCAGTLLHEHPTVTKPRLHRSHSETDAMHALQAASEDPDLIGDFSRRYALPLIPGKHRDLKCITPRTMVDLLEGKFASAIEKFTIVDCRYPYEFEGGHIRGAVNLYQEEMIYETFLRAKTGLPTPQPGVRTELRSIVIFHCEFSSERGPKMSRFLRNRDRQQNKDHYPALHWPEIYLLDGGYKRFYEEFKAYCDPVAYTPMVQQGYEDELRKYRKESKLYKRESRNGRSSSSSKSTCRNLFASDK